MATLFHPAVSRLFYKGSKAATPYDAETTETTGQGTNQEKPVQTGFFRGFAPLKPSWRQPFGRWFLGSVYAKSASASADAANEPGDRVIGKRRGYIGWEEYFMAIAFLSAKRSKDPQKQVGACIVNKDKKIVGTGYNGMPIGCSDDDMPWGKGPKSELENKHLFVCHAEMNAIVNKMEADVRGCTMYVGLFPCNECAKLIVQSGIKEVVYYSDEKKEKDEVRASKLLFQRAHVKYRPYKEAEKLSKVLVDFDDPTA